LQQDIINNKVKAEFYFFSDKLDFSIIDKLMGIKATKKRFKETFPIKDFAADYWILSTKLEMSDDINIQLEKIYNMLPNEKVINKIREQFDAGCGFRVVIENNTPDILPAISFERYFVKYAALIDADISVGF